MYSVKICCILFTLLILYVIYQNCNRNREGFQNTAFTCEDDPEWFVKDKSGKKHHCNDIGISASCYDFDAIGRDGWEQCAKKCGNCVNTQVSSLPMNMIATYSGDPIEDFGVVLQMDEGREWVGTTERQKSTDITDITENEKSLSVKNLYTRLQIMEELFKTSSDSCDTDTATTCTAPEFVACDGNCKDCTKEGNEYRLNDLPITYVKSGSVTTLKTTCTGVGFPNEEDCDNYMILKERTKKETDKEDHTTLATQLSDKKNLSDMCPGQCKKCINVETEVS
jgi:hypothetical protein